MLFSPLNVPVILGIISTILMKKQRWKELGTLPPRDESQETALSFNTVLWSSYLIGGLC